MQAAAVALKGVARPKDQRLKTKQTKQTTKNLKMTLLSNKVINLPESATLKMARLARELKAEGKDVISLSLGEPDFDTPNHIKDAAIQALRDGYTKYTPVSGLPELVQAIITKFERDNGLKYEANQIVVSNGAKQSIYNLSQALLNHGDEAIILAPYWVSYHDIIKMAGGVPVIVKADIDQDFKVTPEQLEAAITPKTKFVLFSSPCNPTGSVYLKEELEGLAAVIAKYDIVVISDEIYEYINFTDKHASIGTIESVKDKTVTVNGFAKGFAMTGWRLGYIGAPLWLAKACAKIQSQVTSGATSFGQKAGSVALTSDMAPTRAMRDAFMKRRELVIGLLKEIPGVKTNFPKGAFYIFPDMSAFFGKRANGFEVNNSDDLAEYLLKQGLVATVSGAAFGDPNCIRISYAASEAQLTEAVRRIGAALGRLS